MWLLIGCFLNGFLHSFHLLRPTETLTKHDKRLQTKPVSSIGTWNAHRQKPGERTTTTINNHSKPKPPCKTTENTKTKENTPKPLEATKILKPTTQTTKTSLPKPNFFLKANQQPLRWRQEIESWTILDGQNVVLHF